MNWFYATKDKTQAGPVDDATLDELLSSGTITPETLIWKEGMSGWKPYAEARQSASSSSTGTQAVCAECGQTFEKSEMIQQGSAWVCAACKPAFLQKLAEGVEINTGTMRYAGFWIRFLAKFVDGLILLIVFGAPMILIMAMTGAFHQPGEEPSDMAVILQIIMQVGYYIVGAAYSIFFVGKFGATPGKMACKLKIVDASGAKIGYGRATGRYFAEILSGIICYIGYLMVAFDPEKRALHDRICNTRVIYK